MNGSTPILFRRTLPKKESQNPIRTAFVLRRSRSLHRKLQKKRKNQPQPAGSSTYAENRLSASAPGGRLLLPLTEDRPYSSTSAAVIIAIEYTSSALQPRDKSLIGAFIPSKIGP